MRSPSSAPRSTPRRRAPPIKNKGSEVEPQRQLQISREIRLARHLSKVGRSRIHAWRAPVGMVHDIEGLGSEFETGAFVQGELLVQAQIPVPEAWLVDEVAHARLQVE